MAKIIDINRPSGQVKGELITAYQRTGTDGSSIVVLNTGRKEGENTVVGVSRKKMGEDTFQNIVDMEEWKNAKKDLVTLLKGKEVEEGLSYLNIEVPIQMTEDGQHEIALRKDNYDALATNYEKAFNSLREVQNVSVVPESEQIKVSPEVSSIMDAPSVAPVSIQPEANPFENVIQPMPKVSPLNEQVAFQDIVPPSDLNVQMTSETPSMEPVQMVSPMPEVNPIVQDIVQVPNMENNEELAANITSAQDTSNTNSAVVNSYLEKSNHLMNRLDGKKEEIDNTIVLFNEQIKEINNTIVLLSKQIKETHEIYDDFCPVVKEGCEYHNLAGETLNKVQEFQAMTSMPGFIPQDNNIVNLPSSKEESISQGRAA